MHRLAEGRALVLGGVRVPHDRGLLGHSDADALAHAVIDALLGAAALGDIGTHFPDTDPRFKDADSLGLLAEAVRMVREAGYAPVNVDATIVAQEPRLGPHLEAMRGNVARALRIGPSDVSVKAKTNEGVGAEGRGEGISVRAVALLDERDEG